VIDIAQKRFMCGIAGIVNHSPSYPDEPLAHTVIERQAGI
jgi:hypothetical protein